MRISLSLLSRISLRPSQVLLSYNTAFLLLLKCAHLSLTIITYLSVPLSALTFIMFDWALFEALHSYVKILAYYGKEFPLSVALILGKMTFTFLTLFVVATLWTIQFSDHITQVFDNTIDIMLEFQVSLQQVMGPAPAEATESSTGGSVVSSGRLVSSESSGLFNVPVRLSDTATDVS